MPEMQGCLGSKQKPRRKGKPGTAIIEDNKGGIAFVQRVLGHMGAERKWKRKTISFRP